MSTTPSPDERTLVTPVPGGCPSGGAGAARDSAAPPGGYVDMSGATGLGTAHVAGGSAFAPPPQAPAASSPAVAGPGAGSAARSPRELGPGSRIGKCEITDKLGEGGMGAVYRAHHATLDIDVALKVITFQPASESERREGVARFIREARAAAKVRHENVISVLDVDSEGGIHYMLMELVEGASARRLCERGALALPEAARIVRDAAQALAAAHRAGIVHRDVKPENILIAQDGRVKVSDFGIAHVAGGLDAKLTRTGQIIGTPHYMSPEQVDGMTLDGRADIYSLGASLFHLVTGTTPFSGPTALQVCMKHLSAPVPSARERNPAIPPALESVIARSMAKRPEERYATADEMARALEPFAGPRRPLAETLAAQGSAAPAAEASPAGTGLAAAPAAASPSPSTLSPGGAPSPEPPPPPARVPLLVGAGALLLGAAMALLAVTRPWERAAAPGPAGPSSAAGAPVASDPSGAVPAIDLAARLRIASGASRVVQLMDAQDLEGGAALADELVAQALASGDRDTRALGATVLYAAAAKLQAAGKAREARARFERLLAEFPEAPEGMATYARGAVAEIAVVSELESISVAPAVLLACDETAYQLSAADLDGDGRPDLALTSGKGRYFTTRGHEPGRFSAARAWPLEALGPPGDDAVELLGVVTGPGGAPRWLTVPFGASRPPRELWAWGPGTDGAPSRISLPRAPEEPGRPDPWTIYRSGDMDGDGRPDLVGFADGGAFVDVHLGTEEGWRAPVRTRLPGPIGNRQLRVAELTGDGRDDVAVVVSGARDKGLILLVLMGGKDGALVEAPFSWRNDSWQPRLGAGDFDGDGRADLCTLDTHRSADRAIVFFRSTGRGYLEREKAKIPVTNAFPGFLELADLDGDGRAELVAVDNDSEGPSLWVYRRGPDGAFAASFRAKLEGVGALVPSAALADLDGDGRIDIALHDYGGGVVVLFGDGKGRFGNR